MAKQSIFLTILFFYMVILFMLQMYFVSRMSQAEKKAANGTATERDQHLTSRGTFRYGLFLLTFYLFAIIWLLDGLWNKEISSLLGIPLLLISLGLIRKPLSMVLQNRPQAMADSIALALQPRSVSKVSPELVEEILREREVLSAIKNDLGKTRQLGGKERWRLGLITPGCDQVDPLTSRLSLTRAAVLHSTTFFLQYNNLMVMHGARTPMIQKYPGWSYRLRSSAEKNQFMNLRDIRVAVDSLAAQGRSPDLKTFLQEDGFPLRNFYPDGDPLTTERGGTVVLDKGAVKIIYPDYFVQRRLIDDEGSVIHMGLDENFAYDSLWDSITLAPSVSKGLYKGVRYRNYMPVVRYRSFPYSSEFLLPILDTPMSDSGWADLFVDPCGKAKLFIAREKTLEEWYAMMERLRQLFFGELARKGNHLLGLTKDQQHLHEYLCKKESILRDYFLIREWSLQ